MKTGRSLLKGVIVVFLVLFIPGVVLSDQPIYDPVGDSGEGFETGDLITAADLNARFQALNSLFKISDGVMTSSGGNIGIGTTSPTEKLEVAGNIKGVKIEGTKFQGAPWRSPAYHIVNIGGTRPFYLLALDWSGWEARRYVVPYTVRIEGVIVAYDGEASDALLQVQIAGDSVGTIDLPNVSSGTPPPTYKIPFYAMAYAGEWIEVWSLGSSEGSDVLLWFYGRYWEE